MKKRGISAVIATVLLIFLTVIAVGIVAGIIIPAVRNWLDEGKKCYEAIDKISIETGDYTCYNSADTRVMIRRSMDKEFELEGLLISLTTGAEAEPYTIKNKETIIDVKMYDGSEILWIPEPGEAKTYVFIGKLSNYIRVAPILPGNSNCARVIEEKLEKCREDT